MSTKMRHSHSQALAHTLCPFIVIWRFSFSFAATFRLRVTSNRSQLFFLQFRSGSLLHGNQVVPNRKSTKHKVQFEIYLYQKWYQKSMSFSRLQKSHNSVEAVFIKYFEQSDRHHTRLTCCTVFSQLNEMPVQPFTIKPYGSDAIIHTDSERRIGVDGSVKRGMLLLCVGVWVRARPNGRTNGAEDGRSPDEGPAKQRMHFDRLRVWLVCEIVAIYV